MHHPSPMPLFFSFSEKLLKDKALIDLFHFGLLEPIDAGRKLDFSARDFGAAGLTPLNFQRYLRDHARGHAEREWSRFVPAKL